jgi:hypothetical protein
MLSPDPLIDFTSVVGVDAKHLAQLQMTWPTWKRHKPSLLNHRMLIFYDRDQVTPEAVRLVVDHPNMAMLPWPMRGVSYQLPNTTKWNNSQRYKMLAGFVHVPAIYCHTKYWLKLDTDVVATGNDGWIDRNWFAHTPAIVSHPWGFSKPADQMLILDDWANTHADVLPYFVNPPLNLKPGMGDDKVRHPRIISWCAFFNLDFTRLAARMADNSAGRFALPVPSQDGYLWYVAQRMNLDILRIDMKSLGWEHWHTMANVSHRSQEVMSNG